jgi:methyl-accepting chemotaxis protein
MKKSSCSIYSLPVLLLVLLLVVSVACSFYLFDRGQKDAAIAAQDAVIKSEVQTAVSMLTAINAKAKAGEISATYARNLGADLLRSMSYGQNGYFWADTAEGKNVVLYGDKKVEGTNRLNAEMNGIKYVQRIIAAGQQPGGGYSAYLYPKKGGIEPKAKRSFSLYFEPFNWVVGTGYYVEDVK